MFITKRFLLNPHTPCLLCYNQIKYQTDTNRTYELIPHPVEIITTGSGYHREQIRFYKVWKQKFFNTPNISYSNNIEIDTVNPSCSDFTKITKVLIEKIIN